MRIAYGLATGLLGLVMTFSAVMYLGFHGEVAPMFEKLGYPTYLIYPLAIAKILGVVAILTRKSAVLAEWAYAGFFFDSVLATMAHGMVGDIQGVWPAVMVVIATLASYRLGKKLRAHDALNATP